MNIEEKLVITWGKEQMVPKQKIVDDIKFICLDKWNRSLIKLLTGRALDMREGKQTGSLRSPVWEEIIQARQAKANELLQEAKTLQSFQSGFYAQCNFQKKERFLASFSMGTFGDAGRSMFPAP